MSDLDTIAVQDMKHELCEYWCGNDCPVTRVTPSIYVGTYEKYNNGSIAGKWLNLLDYAGAEEFFEACKELHKNENDPEFMAQDFEGYPKEFYEESMSFDNIQAIYSYLALEDEDRELLEEYCEATGENINSEQDIEDIRDKLFCILDYTHSNDDENAMADYVIENGLIDVPTDLQYYIDYYKLGQSYLENMSVSSNGYVFTN